MKKVLIFTLSLLLLVATVVFVVWASVGDFRVTYAGKDAGEVSETVYVSKKSPLVLHIEKPLLRTYTFQLETVAESDFTFLKGGILTKLPSSMDASEAFDVSVKDGIMTVTPTGNLEEVLGILTGSSCTVDDELIISSGNLFEISFYTSGSEPVATFAFTLSPKSFVFTLPQEVVF